MQISNTGLALIKKYEGFEADPYLCPAGVPTIGYGATYYPSNNTRVSMQDASISEQEASQLLGLMVQKYADGVNRYVKVELQQCQFDALVSFAYNLGLGALQKSTLLRKVNADPCDPSIDYEFKRWVKAGGKTLKGLVKRREEEADLYFSC